MKQITKLTRRKYYLHRRVGAFCKVSSRSRQISITEAAKEALVGRQKAQLDELITIFKYNIQYSMPVC